MTPSKKPKMLIVDDEVVICRLAEFVFGDQYEITFAVSVADGLAAANRHDFDVALVDDCLPDGRGVEIFEYFEHQSSTCLRYLVTGNLRITQELSPEVLRHVSVVYKPLDLKNFVSSLAVALAERSRKTATSEYKLSTNES